MKGIMITAPSSGSGKTTITMGIIRAIKNMGNNVCAFKTGPDYIDTAFLSKAAGRIAGNLDMHLQGENGMKMALSLGEGDMCVIEGVMGYFDGMHNTFINSSYDISKKIGANAVLVYTMKGEMFSAVPKIKGMVDFNGSMIKGVILNRVKKTHFDMIKGPIEEYTGVKVIGYVPPMEDVELESRHLGLVQSLEIEDIEERLEKLSKTIMDTVDMNMLIELMSELDVKSMVEFKKRNIKVGIAYDKAFSFYYRENIYMLEKTCEVKYFSPINDKEIPECDLIYLGGGYPEVFSEELSKNTEMRNSIREFAQNGGCIFGECGGFMYLTNCIDGIPMAGVFNGESTMTKSLQRFGYLNMELKEDCLLGKKGEKLTAHEFHKSKTVIDDSALYKIKNAMGSKEWECGYGYKNTLAGYPHINFIGNIPAFNRMLDYIEERKNN